MSLSPKAFDILFRLVQRAGHVVTKEELLEAVWPGLFVSENNLTQHIFWVRKALQDRARIITTVPSRGYELKADISVRGQNTNIVSTLVVIADPPAKSASLPAMATQEDGTESLEAKFWSQYASLTWVALVLLLVVFGAAIRNKRPFQVVASETKRLTEDGYPKDTSRGPVPLVSDGNFLYFTEVRENRTMLAKVPVGGGEVAVTDAPYPDAVVVDYSASQGALLIGSVWHTNDDRPILIQKPVGSASRPLGELIGHDASFSPDGRQIAFAKGHLLYVANSDGSSPHSVAGSTGIICQPRWSPDGKVIRFTRSLNSMQKQLWDVSTDGSNARQLFTSNNDRDKVCCGNWTKDGRFSSTCPEGLRRTVYGWFRLSAHGLGIHQTHNV